MEAHQVTLSLGWQPLENPEVVPVHSMIARNSIVLPKLYGDS